MTIFSVEVNDSRGRNKNVVRGKNPLPPFSFDPLCDPFESRKKEGKKEREEIEWLFSSERRERERMENLF